MGRPIVLIPPKMMEEMYMQYNHGVSLRRVIRNLKCDNCISPPTLSKLFEYFRSAAEMPDPKINEVITKSLFPIWILNKDKPQQAPSNYIYIGKMPFGYWLKKD